MAVRFGYSEADESSSQDERFRSRVHIKHGFNDLYAAEIVVSQDRRKGDNLEHDAVTLENHFHLLKAEGHGFDFGVRANYTMKDGDKKADEASFGFYELIPLGEYEIRMNQILGHEVGEDSDDGLSAELRFQATKKISETHRLGLESFHDLGSLQDMSGYSDQSHQFGPVLKGKIGGGYAYETGYRAGISEGAPDHNFKVFISRDF